MNKNNLLKKSDGVYAQYRLMKLAFFTMMIGMIGLGVMVYQAVQYKTVVIVPPNLEKPVEFTNGIPDDEYMRTVAQDITYLAFNYTPATCRTQFNTLLKYVAPEEFPVESQRWYELAGKVEASRVSSTMALSDKIIVNPTAGEIQITGSRTQFTGDQIIETKNKTYLIKYALRRGKFALLGIVEGSKR